MQIKTFYIIIGQAINYTFILWENKKFKVVNYETENLRLQFVISSLKITGRYLMY